jgi:uncharacterized membrane protein YdcZ (DUF606 family)
MRDEDLKVVLLTALIGAVVGAVMGWSMVHSKKQKGGELSLHKSPVGWLKFAAGLIGILKQFSSLLEG